MIRVNFDALLEHNGLLWFEGTLFTGVFFRVEGIWVVAAQCVHAGEITGVYNSPLGVEISRSEPALFIDEDDEENQDRIILGDPPRGPDGSMFFGVSYEFDEHWCVAETLITDEKYFNIDFYPVNCALERIEKSNDKMIQIYYFRPDGYLTEAKMSSKNLQFFSRNVGIAKDGTTTKVELEQIPRDLEMHTSEQADKLFWPEVADPQFWAQFPEKGTIDTAKIPRFDGFDYSGKQEIVRTPKIFL